MATPTLDKLAIDGGTKIMTDLRSKGRNKIGVEEFFAVAERFGFKPEALAKMKQQFTDADLIPGGPNFARWFSANPRPAKGEIYEQKACEKFGVKFARGVSSGTGALHCAMVGVGAGPGKEVIVPALGFLATGMAAALCGAKPVFCDVDESLQLDPSKLEKLINKNTVAVAPTHHWGYVADMDPIVAIARKHGIKVIEDCAQSPGATYRGKPVGSIGDIGCFSISCYKIIGGGESGLFITNNEEIWSRANQMYEGGGLWRPNRFAPARWPQELFVGTNYRLSELEAAINLVQLEKLDGFVADYRKSCRRVLSQLKKFREITPQKHNDPAGDIGYMVRFFAQTPALAEKLAKALQAEGLGCGFRPVDRGPDWHIYYDMFPISNNFQTNSQKGACPVADDLWAREMMFGIGMGMDDHDLDLMAAALNKVFGAYCTESSTGPGWI